MIYKENICLTMLLKIENKKSLDSKAFLVTPRGIEPRPKSPQSLVVTAFAAHCI